MPIQKKKKARLSSVYLNLYIFGYTNHMHAILHSTLQHWKTGGGAYLQEEQAYFVYAIVIILFATLFLKT